MVRRGEVSIGNVKYFIKLLSLWLVQVIAAEFVRQLAKLNSNQYRILPDG
jgi:hypothetical protein